MDTKHIKTGVQQIMLGTVCKNEQQTRETLRAIKSAGYDGIELNGFMIRPSSMMVRLLTKFAGMPTGNGGKFNWKGLIDDAGLSVLSIHEDLQGIKNDPSRIIKEAEDFRCKTIVITGMYRFDYQDPDALSTLCRDLNDCGKILKDSGISLLYHNHNIELLNLRGAKPAGFDSTAYAYIVNHTDPEMLGFELDSYWFTDGGANVPAIMKLLGKRMRFWHINDRGTKVSKLPMTPILKSDSMELGYGNMDLDGLSALALENDIEAVVLESHRNFAEGSPIRSLQLSAAYMKRFHS